MKQRMMPRAAAPTTSSPRPTPGSVRAALAGLAIFLVVSSWTPAMAQGGGDVPWTRIRDKAQHHLEVQPPPLRP